MFSISRRGLDAWSAGAGSVDFRPPPPPRVAPPTLCASPHTFPQGNAAGALGDWSGAERFYRRAATLDDVGGDVEGIARQNLALTLLQRGEFEASEREARSLVRRDGGFLDARAALVAALWAQGASSEAEAEWAALQAAQDGLGGELYPPSGAIDRVAPRWPPRATAALAAFLSLSRSASATDYSGKTVDFSF